MSGSSIDRSRTSCAGRHARRAPRRPSSPRRRTRAAGAARRPRSRRGVVPGHVGRGRASARPGRRRGPAARRRSRQPGSVPSKASRPWSTTRTRSQSRSMSPMSWVVSSSVVPRSARSATRNSRSRCFESTSRPIVGSSRMSSSGECSSAAAISAAHPLAERQLAHRGVERARPISSCSTSSSVRAARRARRRAGGSRPRMRERLAQRQVPPQLRALAEDDADAPGQLAPLAHRVQPARAHRARTSAPGCRSAS